MHIVVQIALTVAAVTLVVGIVWLMYGTMLTPVRCEGDTRLSVVISAEGSAQELEQVLKGLIWLQKNGTLQGQILIADCGMNDEGRTLARQMLKKHLNIAICSAGEIDSFFA